MVDGAIIGIVVWLVSTPVHILLAGSVSEYISFYVDYSEHRLLTIVAWVFLLYFLTSLLLVLLAGVAEISKII